LRLLNQAPPGAVTITVASTATFDVAFARAQADPTRGISKEHGFLSGVYQRWTDELGRINPDVVIDTSVLTIEQGIERIQAAIDSARMR